MLFRTMFALAAFVMAGQPLAAEPAASDRCTISQGPAERQLSGESCKGAEPLRSGEPTVHIHAGPGPLGDIIGGRGVGTQARELGKIANAAAAGDRTEIEILSRELRASGVSAEEISDAAAQMWPRTHRHGTPAREDRDALTGGGS